MDIQLRDMIESDDKQKVAELIYNTDDYIYPYLFDGDLHTGRKVLCNMIDKDTIYNRRNIKVAVMQDEIVGIIVYSIAPVVVNAKEMMDSFVQSNAIVGERFVKVYNEYFKLLEDEPDGVYIANVCVDKKWRGKGVGHQMMSAFLQKDKTYNLETVKANKPAVSLYSSVGFEVQCEYPGFTAVPCYRMKKLPERK